VSSINNDYQLFRDLSWPYRNTGHAKAVFYYNAGPGSRRRNLSSRYFLALNRPEPWNAAYVQPSRRPTDGRFGENPNRLQHYYQFQVVLKPSPDNIQELYLGSLRHLGLDLLEHDVRFVEDNWESPTLGAWGLGWEVWLNGMEVTSLPTSSRSADSNANPSPVKSPTVWSASPCTYRALKASTIWSGPKAVRHCQLWRCVPSKRSGNVHL